MVPLLLFYMMMCITMLDLKINFTSSMPIGIYQKVDNKTFHRGDWVSVCLPKSIAREGLDKGYLVRGFCGSGTMPVLKMIIAVPSDDVELTEKTITVNDKTYLAPHQAIDHLGNHVHQFIKNGHYHSTEYWLYGICNTEHSWDSRYYGAIGREHIMGRYRLIMKL